MAEGQSVSWALLTKVDGATLLLSLRPELGRSRGSRGDKGAGNGRGAERKLGAVDKSRWRNSASEPSAGAGPEPGGGAIKGLVMAEGQSVSWVVPSCSGPARAEALARKNEQLSCCQYMYLLQRKPYLPVYQN